MEEIKDGELVMVFTVFRHGARSPLRILPNDPNQNYWPEGSGQLTNEGKKQAFEMGKVYRQQYDGFLSSNYKREELYVYSTDVDRTIMSAQCCLAGMYPPSGEQLWNANLPWQPIPVHTNNRETDPHFFDLSPLRIKELPSSTKPRHIEIYENITVKHKDEWDAWMKISSPDSPTIATLLMTLDTVGLEVTLFLAQMKAGLPYVVPPNLNIRLGGALLLQASELFLELIPRFASIGRALLNAVLAAIEGHIDGSNATKMYMYSLHDLSMMSAMVQLNIFKGDRPGYCGHYIFELYKSRANGAYYVKLLCRETGDSELIAIPMADDLPYLPLDAFQQLARASQKLAESPP